MRDLVYYIATSADGFIADPGGGTGAFPHHPGTLTDLFERYPETCPAHLREALGVAGRPRRFDTVLMGYRTFEPARDAGLTSAYPHLREIVVTHRDLGPDTPVDVWSGDLDPQIRALKDEPGADIWLCGGADLAGQLIDHIDELQLKVNPLLLGDGLPLLVDPSRSSTGLPLRLVEATTLPGDVVLLTYRTPVADGKASR